MQTSGKQNQQCSIIVLQEVLKTNLFSDAALAMLPVRCLRLNVGNQCCKEENISFRALETLTFQKISTGAQAPVL